MCECMFMEKVGDGVVVEYFSFLCEDYRFLYLFIYFLFLNKNFLMGNLLFIIFVIFWYV